MSKFLRALQKAGLVELDTAGTPPIEHAVSAPPAEPEPLPEPVAVEPTAPAGPLSEGRAFDAIYAELGVVPAPFSAEKLLKIFDGLAALDPVSRKTAVMALDAADDSWAIDDALADADAKVRALGQARAQIESQARAALEQARADVETRDAQQADAVARVRAQIADLEGLLEREVARATEEKAAVHASAKATKDLCLREVARLDAEALRLRTLAQTFGVAPSAAAAR
jgi:hypothetical protein